MTRLSAALNSDDLQHHNEYLCDVNIIHAAGVGHMREPLGVLIVEAKEGCAGEGSDSVARIRSLEQALCLRVSRWAKKWRVQVFTHLVADHIVRELLLNQCVRCQGRGFLPLAYGIESDGEGGAQCTDCVGTGKARPNHQARAIAAGWPQYHPLLDSWFGYVLSRCDEAESTARREMGRFVQD